MKLAPTLAYCVWPLYVPMPEARTLQLVPACAGRRGAAGFSPEGALFHLGVALK